MHQPATWDRKLRHFKIVIPAQKEATLVASLVNSAPGLCFINDQLAPFKLQAVGLFHDLGRIVIINLNETIPWSGR